LSEFLFYDTTYENKVIASKGDLHHIVKGIPAEDVLIRNAIFALRLEALRLEFLAKTRLLRDTDYYNSIISDDKLEEYLKEWEQEAEKDRELKHAAEELENKTQKKKQEKREKLAAKRAEKAATKPKKDEKGLKPDPLPAKPTPAITKDPLVVMLDSLLSRLNPGRYHEETIQQVISKLYPLTQASSNKEVVFQALSAMGDSYGMIAGHYLNSKKHPKELIVNLQLAVNYYKQAELTLRRLDDISQDQHLHYYTWLNNSIRIQQRLLDQYTEKFNRLHGNLCVTKERVKKRDPKKWKENCLQEGWSLSDRAKERIALEEALSAVAIMKKHSVELTERTKGKARACDDNITYTFENYLHAAGKIQVPEPALNYTLNENEAAEPLMPDADVENNVREEPKAETSKQPNPPVSLPDKPVDQPKKAATVIRILSRTAQRPATVVPSWATTAAAHTDYVKAEPAVVFTRPVSHAVVSASPFSLTISDLAKEIFKVLDIFLDNVDQKPTEELMNNRNVESVNDAITLGRVSINEFSACDLSMFLHKLARIITDTNGFDNWLLKNQYFPEECLKIVGSKLSDFTQQGLRNCIWAFNAFGINNLTLLTDLYAYLITNSNKQNNQTSTSLSSQFSVEISAQVVSSTHTAPLWQTQTNSRTEYMEL